MAYMRGFAGRIIKFAAYICNSNTCTHIYVNYTTDYAEFIKITDSALLLLSITIRILLSGFVLH